MIAVMNLTNFIAILLSGAIYMAFDRLIEAMHWPRSILFAFDALLILPVALFYRPRVAAKCHHTGPTVPSPSGRGLG